MALADFLVSEARILEQGIDTAKKEVKEQIPSDRVKDAPAMARELRWRLRLAAGSASDEEGPKKADRTNGHINGVKRRRVDSEGVEEGSLRFRNFKPRPWDRIEDRVEDLGTEIKQVISPGTGDAWVDTWINPDNPAGDVMEGSQQAEVVRQRTMVVKVRRTPKGLERQRIERTVEQWSWHSVE